MHGTGLVHPSIGRAAIAAAFITGLVHTAEPAQAVTITPSGDVVASGKLRYKKSFVTVECDTRFVAHITEDGQLTVHNAEFGRNGLCRFISALALPWRGQAQGNHILVIHNATVQVEFPVLGGVCGPSRLELAWDNAQSTLTFKDALLKSPEGRDCVTNGVVSVVPPLDVKP
ncbi:MAG: hypothetical protein NZ533_11580 [Casimicrobiaceae bacterium]|nr:hypothetical protein [Casimicrobiaceae bacterium]MCX8003770.1 hypothetical protein [Burkholderiaceae bacterium]